MGVALVRVGMHAAEYSVAIRRRWLPPRPFARYRRTMDADDNLTDDHMRLMLWLDAHPTGSLVAAAQALGLAITDVEGLCANLVDAEMIEHAPMQ